MKFQNGIYTPRPDRIQFNGSMVDAVNHNGETVWIDTLGASDAPKWTDFNSTSPYSSNIYYYLNPFELTQDDIEINVTDTSYHMSNRYKAPMPGSNLLNGFAVVFNAVKKHPKTGAFELDARNIIGTETLAGTDYNTYGLDPRNVAHIQLPELVVDGSRHYAYSIWIKPDFTKSTQSGGEPNVGVITNSNLFWSNGSSYNAGMNFRVYAGADENSYNGQSNPDGFARRSSIMQMTRYSTGYNMQGSGCPGWETQSSTYYIQGVECNPANDLLWRDIDGNPSLSNPKWTHYMITRTGLNGHVLKIYRDGMLVGGTWNTTSSSYEMTVNGSNINNSYRSQQLLIGAYGYDKSYKTQGIQSRFCGLIGEFVAWRGVELTDADVSSIYMQKSSFYTNLDQQ